MIAFLTSRLGLAVMAAIAVAVFLACLYFRAYEAGAASAVVAAAVEAARRAQKANQARAKVDQSEDAIRSDKYNRDAQL